MFQLWDIGWNLTLPGTTVDPNPPTVECKGLNGKTASWNGSPTDDPFPTLLDPQLWDARKIGYAAAAFPMSTSIGVGVNKMVGELLKTPRGTKFALGGYSQGASVASRAFKKLVVDNYDGRASDFIGGVTFGNPDRKLNHTNPHSSWSGAWDIPGSTTGSHGCFPLANRMTTAPESWWDFVHENELITGTGDSESGAIWTRSAGFVANNDLVGLVNVLSLVDDVVATFFGITTLEAQTIKTAGEIFVSQTEFAGANGTSISLGGGGHVAYPFLPPTGYSGTETSYQLALEYLEGIARDALVAPIVIPQIPGSNALAGWSTSLIAPS